MLCTFVILIHLGDVPHSMAQHSAPNSANDWDAHFLELFDSGQFSDISIVGYIWINDIYVVFSCCDFFVVFSDSGYNRPTWTSRVGSSIPRFAPKYKLHRNVLVRNEYFRYCCLFCSLFRVTIPCRLPQLSYLKNVRMLFNGPWIDANLAVFEMKVESPVNDEVLRECFRHMYCKTMPSPSRIRYRWCADWDFAYV